MRDDSKNASRQTPKKAPTLGYFKDLSSFIGSDIADPRSEQAEKPPKSAKHVVTVSWPWTPMHSRTSEYRIAVDRRSDTWNLYELSWDDDSGEQVSARVGTGSPSKAMDEDRASYLILRAVWKSEIELWDFDPAGFQVEDDGVLTRSDVAAVVNDLAWMTQSSWLRSQSDEGFELLRLQLPRETDEQTLEVLADVESCAKELKLSIDFTSLCAHFDLEPPSLLCLVNALVKEAASSREARREKATRNVDEYREKIDALISDLDSRIVQVAGMTRPSVREATRAYLERYVGENAALPSGEKVVHSFFKIAVNFDELRKKHGF